MAPDVDVGDVIEMEAIESTVVHVWPTEDLYYSGLHAPYAVVDGARRTGVTVLRGDRLTVVEAVEPGDLVVPDPRCP